MLNVRLELNQDGINDLERIIRRDGFDSMVDEDQEPDIDHSPEEVAESLRRAWEDMKAGRFLTEADYRKAMAEEDEG